MAGYELAIIGSSHMRRQYFFSGIMTGDGMYLILGSADESWKKLVG